MVQDSNLQQPDHGSGALPVELTKGESSFESGHGTRQRKPGNRLSSRQRDDSAQRDGLWFNGFAGFRENVAQNVGRSVVMRAVRCPVFRRRAPRIRGSSSFVFLNPTQRKLMVRRNEKRLSSWCLLLGEVEHSLWKRKPMSWMIGEVRGANGAQPSEAGTTNGARQS